MILESLFESWKQKGLSFCVTNENYNKMLDSSVSGGGHYKCLLSAYPRRKTVENRA